MSPNSVALRNVVFKPKLLNNPLASCFFTNLDISLLQTAHFHNRIVLQCLVFKVFESKRSVSFLYLKE